MGVGALIDVEVVVGGEGRHLQVDGVGRLHLGPGLSGQALHELRTGLLDIFGEGLDVRRVVVVGLDVALDRLDERGGILEGRREGELVHPHRRPAEFALVDPHGDELAAPIGLLQGGHHRQAAFGLEGLGEGLVSLDLLLHLPEGLDAVPVAVIGRVLQPAEQGAVHRAAGLLDDGLQSHGPGELGEVEHPVDLPVTIVDVHCVFEDGRPLQEVDLLPVVDLALEVLEVALDLGDEPVAPPAVELPAVHREHRSQIGADLACVAGVGLGHPGPVDVAVLLAVDQDVGVGQRHGGVQVAVDVLGDPVHGERRAEAAEHVVAGEPPAADVEVHRGQGVRAVEVVERPRRASSRPRCPT